MFNRSVLIALLGVGVVAACASYDDVSPSAAETEAKRTESVDAAIARIVEQMADLPGEPVITRSDGGALSDDTIAALLAATKIVHVFSDGRVRGYIVRETKTPEGVPPTKVFYEAAGDTIIGRIEELPDYLRQLEQSAVAGGGLRAQSVGLAIGHGALFPGSTVPYEIDGSFAGSELDVLKRSIGSWNEARGPSGEAIRVRFVPRYPNDGRPYIRFVRTVSSSYCGQSQVGRHDNIFTNWWSHNIDIACVTEHTIHHEMGHTVGLYHEQQRCDRDQFVGVTLGGFNCDRLCGSAVDYGTFNYASVMGYPYNRADACGINQIAPSSGSYRGAPWMFGASWPIDSYDVAAINQMYTGQPGLPNLARGIYYLILPEHAPGKGIIIGGMNRDNGTPAIQWQSLAEWPDQHWEIAPDGAGFFEIRNRNSGKCLEISGWTMTDGANLGQWDCFGGDHQKWSVAPSMSSTGRFDIINKWSNKSVDIEGSSTANGARVTQWPHHGGANQRFAFSRVF